MRGVSFSDEQFEALLDRLAPPHVQNVERRPFSATDNTIRWGAQASLNFDNASEGAPLSTPQLVHVFRDKSRGPTSYNVAFVTDLFGFDSDTTTFTIVLKVTIGVGSASVTIEKTYTAVPPFYPQINDLFQVPATSIHVQSTVIFDSAFTGHTVICSMLVAPVVE